MKKNSILFNQIILVAFLLTSSCTSITSTFYDVNKKKSFATYSDYKDFIQNKTNLKTGKLLIIRKEDEQNLLKEIMNTKTGFYYGIVKEDKVYTAQKTIKESQHCMGAINNYLTNSENLNGNYKEDVLSEFSYTTIDGKRKDFNCIENTAVFIYSYKMGGGSRQIEKTIKELNEKTDLNYQVISIDVRDIKSY